MITDPVAVSRFFKPEVQFLGRVALRPSRAQWVSRDHVLQGNTENHHFMIGILYKVTHFNHDNNLDAMAQARKKQKKGYDRMFFFGDIKGGTYCIVGMNEKRSRTMCHHCVSDIAVGQAYVLEKCYTNDGSTLRNDMPVLSFASKFYPLVDEFVEELDPIPIMKPDTGGETTFFIIKNAKVELLDITLVGKGDTYPPCCNGKFCDRMTRLKSNREACGCFAMNAMTSSVVLEVDIKHIDENKAHCFKANEHRSLRTTEMFIDNLALLCTNSTEQRAAYAHRLEDCVEACNDYINNNGGYTIMGTVSRGQMSDISNVNEKVASTRVTFAVSYIQPTNLGLLKEPEYRSMMFRLFPEPAVIDLVDDVHPPAGENEASNDQEVDAENQNKKPRGRPRGRRTKQVRNRNSETVAEDPQNESEED